LNYPDPAARRGVESDEALGVALIATMGSNEAPPQGHADAPRKALLVDSWYDPYLGVVTLVQR
jgi:GTP-binding protein LepA